MKNRMLFAPLASALLLLGSCNADNKPVETTTEDNTASGDTAVVMTNADPEAMYRARGRRIADRVYTDLKVQDTAVRSRLATTYYSRAKRYGELQTQYQADTTGQYQAMRQAEMEYEKQVQTVLTDPEMYKAYEAHRTDYADQKYMDTDMSSDAGSMSSDASMNDGAASGSASASDAGMASGKMEGDNMSGDKAKVKLKGEDGSKIKMKKGDVKVKDADGTKTKMNGD
jgi:hypothetical protein